jgi:transposase InsO family protein
MVYGFSRTFSSPSTFPDLLKDPILTISQLPEIFEYIEVFYNKIRIHSANNYLAPVEFEKVNRKYLKSA